MQDEVASCGFGVVSPPRPSHTHTHILLKPLSYVWVIEEADYCAFALLLSCFCLFLHRATKFCTMPKDQK